MFKKRIRYHKRKARHRYPETGGAHKADPLHAPWTGRETRVPSLVEFREAQEQVHQTRWYFAGSSNYNSQGEKEALPRPHGKVRGSNTARNRA